MQFWGENVAKQSVESWYPPLENTGSATACLQIPGSAAALQY